MVSVTIITPTYNRKNRLPGLYNSLISQNDKDFEWLIIDDGSSDGTEELINQWKEEAIIEIRYIRKKNGGKHTALNCGISTISSVWTFIVDSDDWLSSNAIEVIKNRAKQFDDEDVCGFAFLRQSNKGGYLTNKLVPLDGLKETFVECRYKRGIMGDMAEVWKTSCLKEFPFPEFENEKFISEDVVWISLADKYKMIFFNEAIYFCDYLGDGLTVNRRKHNMQSPRGVMYRGELQLKQKLPIKFMCRAMLYYSIYGKVAGMSWKHLLFRTNRKILYCLLFPISVILYRKWSR